MPIGIVGPSISPLIGQSINPMGLVTSSLAGVTQDATSLWYLPASVSELTTFVNFFGLFSGFASPLAIYNCQEGSGDLADSSGNGHTLVHTGAASYGQTMAGWSRKFITSPDAATINFHNTDAGLPDISTTSFLAIMLGTITGVPAATRILMCMGTTLADLQTQTTKVARTVSGANNAAGSTTMAVNTPIFMSLRVDRNAGTTVAATNADKMAPAQGVITGKSFSVHTNTPSSNSAPFGFGYILLYSGANAQATDAQLKALEQAMGATVIWS